MASLVRLNCPSCSPRLGDFGGGDAGVARPGLEVLLHEIDVEDFVAGGDRGVRGEDGVSANRSAGVAEVFAAHDPLANAFEGEHGDMPFVHVPHRGLNSQGPQGAHASDPEDDLLGEAHLPATNVEKAR